MAATIACQRCGAANSAANQFCSNCGVPFLGSIPPTIAPTPAPVMWPPPPTPRSTSNLTVLVVVLVIVIGVVLAGVAAVLIGRQIVNTVPPGTGPRVMGISVSRSADGTNWSLLIA